MHLEGEGGHHAEIAATAAQGPEEIGMVVRVDGEELAIGGDDFGGDDVVAAQTEGAHEVAESAAHGEPADAGGGDDPAGGGETGVMTGGIELGPGDAALDDGGVALGIDGDLLHSGKVDHHAAVADRAAGDTVPAAADSEGELVRAGECDGGGDVMGVAALDDEGGIAVDHRVPDPAFGVVFGIGGGDDGAGQLAAQLVDGRGI